MRRISRSSLFLAFNKSIAEELKGRGVNARTFHSLTYSPVTRHKKVKDLTANKLRILCEQNLTGKDSALYTSFACRLVSLGKQMGIGCLVPDIEQTWLDLCIHHDLEPEQDDADLGKGIKIASDLLDWSNQSSMVDFDDLLYVAVKDGLILPKFDIIFVDEAQDTNAIQRALLRKLLGDRSRLIAVGDPAQAIYGFRGADSNSLALIKKEFDCQSLPLSISYRCPQAVVKYAQQWLPSISAAPGATVGVVEDLETRWDHKTFLAEDLVVCRTTAPLISLAFKLMRKRVPVSVIGRDIGQNLKALVNRFKASELSELDSKLEFYCDKEVEKAKAKGDDAKVERIQDMVESLRCLIEGLDEDENISDLVRIIDNLFSSRANAVILSTIHKAKGLEADRVFWLDRKKCPSKWAKKDWQMQQEENLCYVATTRAKEELYFIEF